MGQFYDLTKTVEAIQWEAGVNDAEVMQFLMDSGFYWDGEIQSNGTIVATCMMNTYCGLDLCISDFLVAHSNDWIILDRDDSCPLYVYPPEDFAEDAVPV